MAGLVPAIHVFETSATKDVDPQNKPGDDGEAAFYAAFARRSSGVTSGGIGQT